MVKKNKATVTVGHFSKTCRLKAALIAVTILDIESYWTELWIFAHLFGSC